jgi:hypothetical protein
MHDPALYTLTWRVARRRLLANPLAPAAAVLFPAFVVWLGLRDSYETAAKFFFFLVPHLFLVAAQDTVRTDLESGALENVLFIGGRFRSFLRAKSAVLAGAVAAYACALFAALAVWGLLTGKLEPVHAAQFGLGLLAGIYYAGVAGALSYVLRAGSNTLVLLLAQSAVLIGLLFSATSRAGFIDGLAAGRFTGLGSRLTAAGLVAVLPNLVVSRRLSVFGFEVMAGLALAILAQAWLSRRLELER